MYSARGARGLVLSLTTYLYKEGLNTLLGHVKEELSCNFGT